MAIDNPMEARDMRDAARKSMAAGVAHPFDGRQPTDNAHRVAHGILAQLVGRRGLGQVLEDVDDDVRVEIVEIIAELIRLGAQPRVEHKPKSQ
jgi:hypothetical protein